MPPRSGVNRIELGPIVGHTDHRSGTVWIKVFDEPGNYRLRVMGVGSFDFVSTETTGPMEFRTAIARPAGLKSDHIYRYAVTRLGRILANGRGTFRTSPDPASLAPITFCAISCNIAGSDGAWKALGKFIEDSKPQFLLMMGDQIYLDEDGVDVFRTHLNSTPKVRRAAIAEKYRINWSREVVRKVLANIPVYMMWDDHDIRDGWGSAASDSETLVAKHTRGRPIFDKCQAYYEDCRDVFWHFQACHNPRPGPDADPLLFNYVDGPATSPARYAMPNAFRCGRTVVAILDSRGERDVFRAASPILGARQWQFLDDLFTNLPADVEALVVMTPTPVASLDPEGQTLDLMGERTDDVEAFRRGDEENTLFPDSGGASQAPAAILNHHLSPIVNAVTGSQLNLGSFKIGNIDEARDQWSHKFAQPEQRRLIRSAGQARLANRTPGSARGLIFVSGDIHVGARFTITCADPPFTALSLTSSGISTVFEHLPVVGALLDIDFDVAPGIHSTMLEVVTEVNFGIVNVIPTGRGAEIQGVVAHRGNSLTLGLDITLYL